MRHKVTVLMLSGIELERALRNAAGRQAPRSVHARVVAGDPAAEISRVAEESAADLILVGVTRYGAIGRLFFGSTANRVIRTSGREVLAMPPLAA